MKGFWDCSRTRAEKTVAMRCLVTTLLFLLVFIVLPCAVPPSIAGGASPERYETGTGCRSDLILHVIGMKNDSGVARANLFDSETAWNNHKGSIMHDAVPVTHGEAVIIFHDVLPGRYAVMLYHDTNNNDALDRNVIGLPVENYGFSHNVRPVFSLPSFRSASFVTGCDATHLEITVR